MKKWIRFFLVLVLVFCFLPLTPVQAQSKNFIPVGADGSAFSSPSVEAGNLLNVPVYFKTIGDFGENKTVNIVSIDIDTKGGDLASFPFDPTQSTYLIQSNQFLRGAGNIPGYQFNMRCRADAQPGYYAVDFIVTYEIVDLASSTPAPPSTANSEGQPSTTASDASTASGAPDATAETVSTLSVVPLAATAPVSGYLTETVTWDVLVKPAASDTATDNSTVGSVPKVLITGFSTNPAEVIAGEDFSLTVTFKNTSHSNSIDNLKAVLTSDGTFNPVSGSSTMFIQHLDPGASSTLTIALHAKADASPGSYNVNFAMSFDAPGVKDPISDAETVAIPVKQVPKVQITSLQTMGNMMVGSDLNAMTTVNNTGKSVLYNVMVTVHDTNGLLSSEELYLGNIQPGATGNVDVYLTAMSPGMTTLTATVTYEDETGVRYTSEVMLDVELMEEIFMEDPMFMDPSFPMEDVEPEKGLPWWLYVIGILIVGGIVTLVILKSIKKRRQRERDLAAARALDEKYLREDSMV